MTTRRQFLQGLVALGALSLCGPVLAAQPRRLVMVHLFGGNDGLNTIVPYQHSAYRKARPTLALSSSQLISLGSGLGMHPALRPLEPLWKQGKMTVVQGVGYEHPERSHFVSSDIWHAAGCAPGEGWLGKLAAGQGWELVQADDQSLSRALWSPQVSPICLHPGADSPVGWPSEVERALQQLYAGSEQRHLARTFAKMQQVRRLRASCQGERWQGSPLRQSLGAVLDTWKMGRIFHATVGGFDTHGDQGRRQAEALGQVAQALAEFYQELQRRGWDKDCLIAVYSEFGRRVEENASQGTDHGGAGPVLLLGGGTRGGLIGEHPDLADLVDGDLRHSIDFRQVYATLLEGWLQTDSKKILGGSFETLPCWA